MTSMLNEARAVAQQTRTSLLAVLKRSEEGD